MEVLARPDFQSSQRLKITLQIYSLNYLGKKTSHSTPYSWSATIQQAAIILQPWTAN